MSNTQSKHFFDDIWNQIESEVGAEQVLSYIVELLENKYELIDIAELIFTENQALIKELREKLEEGQVDGRYRSSTKNLSRLTKQESILPRW